MPQRAINSRYYGGPQEDDYGFTNFAIVGVRAVKAFATEDGGLDVMVYDRQTQSFKRAMEFFGNLIDHTDDTEFVSEQEFDRYVGSLQERPNTATHGR